MIFGLFFLFAREAFPLAMILVSGSLATFFAVVKWPELHVDDGGITEWRGNKRSKGCKWDEVLRATTRRIASGNNVTVVEYRLAPELNGTLSAGSGIQKLVISEVYDGYPDIVREVLAHVDVSKADEHTLHLIGARQ